MKFDSLHLVTLGVGILIGVFVVPMILTWVGGMNK